MKRGKSNGAKAPKPKNERNKMQVKKHYSGLWRVETDKDLSGKGVIKIESGVYFLTNQALKEVRK